MNWQASRMALQDHCWQDSRDLVTGKGGMRLLSQKPFV